MKVTSTTVTLFTTSMAF